MSWADLVAWTQAVLAGMAMPWVIVLVLAATTLLVEDVAIIAGVAMGASGALSWELSFLAVAGGIAVGDLLLYAAGAGAGRLRWAQRHLQGQTAAKVRDRLLRSLPSAVLIARAVPGLRLTTYLACGALRVPLGRFTVLVVLAVCLWTAGLYVFSLFLGMTLSHYTGLPAPLAVALPLVALALALPLVRHLRAQRKGAPA